MEAAADLVIDTTRVPVAEVAERIAVSAEQADGAGCFRDACALSQSGLA